MAGGGVHCVDNKTALVSSGGWGVRHWQCLTFFLGYTIACSNRICLSIAIIAIQGERRGNDELTSNNVGIILSSFLWGYALMQIPSGYLARVWSAKMVFGIGILINGFGSLLCPLALDKGGWMYLCACRAIMGLCQGCCLPCIHTLLSKWVPPKERGRLGTMTYAGGHFGTVISYPISGALIDAVGWRSVFYFFGACAISWSLIFFLLGSDSPAASAAKALAGISDDERKYIESSLGGVEDQPETDDQKPPKTPWRAILTSLPFWSLLIVHCGSNWGSFILHNEIPMYMDGVLGFGIKENGLKSALPFVAVLLLAVPVSWLSDWSEERGVSRGLLRKLCNTVGHWGAGLVFIAICFVPRGDTTMPVVLLVLAGALGVGAMCGFHINHMDLSPRYAGLLVAVTNCAGTIVALVAPLVVAQIVIDSRNADQWKIVFFVSGGIYFLGNLMFILFGSGDTQSWDNSQHSPKFRSQAPLRSRASSIVPDDAVIL